MIYRSLLSLLLLCPFIAVAQDVVWATGVSYDNEISNKDGYNARKSLGPPDVETYGKYSKNAATINPAKGAALWVDFSAPVETKQVLILESNGISQVVKVDLVDAVSGSTFTVYESPSNPGGANYRLLRIVLPDKSMKAKQIKIKFSTQQEQQQLDAVGITSSEEELTLESILTKYAKAPVKYNTAGNDAAKNTYVHAYNAANVNVLNVKKSVDKIGEPLKPGESGNMGRDVNSEYDEIAPIISPDEQTLYYIRSGHPGNTIKTGSEDIWFSLYDKSTGLWGSAQHMGYPFNKSDYNKIVGITPDGNTVMIKGAYREGEYKGRGFSFSHRTRTGWSEPERIDLKGYDNMAKGNYVGSFLSADGKTIMLSFSEKTASDDNDIYVSFLKDNGDWSRPMNLSETFNTEYTEDTPFLSPDGVTLYFASDRPGGLGKRDIYMSKRLDDTWKNWSPAVNLGSSINTTGDDANYSIAASSYYAYMVSSKNSLGGTDVVRMKLKDEIKPNPVVLVSGKVYNAKTREPIDASIAYQTLREGTEMGIARSNPANGDYKIVLPYGRNYSFSAKADGFIAVSDNLDLTTVAAFQEITRDLYLVPVEVGETVRLNNIFFDFGKATLREESFPELDKLVKVLTDNPGMEIEIAGHTDNVGNDESNLKLSNERAASVKAYIISKGIVDSRIMSKGYGETKFIASNDTEEGKQMNRRVEFTILKK
jgi:outer membrane protein OmpA-like peptidoglycan-associated protein